MNFRNNSVWNYVSTNWYTLWIYWVSPLDFQIIFYPPKFWIHCIHYPCLALTCVNSMYWYSWPLWERNWADLNCLHVHCRGVCTRFLCPGLDCRTTSPSTATCGTAAGCLACTNPLHQSCHPHSLLGSNTRTFYRRKIKQYSVPAGYPWFWNVWMWCRIITRSSGIFFHAKCN